MRRDAMRSITGRIRLELDLDFDFDLPYVGKQHKAHIDAGRADKREKLGTA